MLTRTQEVGMVCFLVAIGLVFLGRQVWKNQRTNLIPIYKQKPGENTAAYCAMTGKGMMLGGVGMFILSIPLSQAEPDRYFALICLICCLIFIGMGISMYLRAEKHYHSG